ncbi:MAG: EamA family transporter [Rikenellaceae bacterium]|nr:EamA family transporter [Rikenellaceae bacterium]
MWLTLAFASAALLGLYDVVKKKALIGNAVLPVLLLNILFSTFFFLPALLAAELGFNWFDGTLFAIHSGSFNDHVLVAIKSCIVLSSWIFGYFAMKNLPITIVGPINATRPVMVLLGAMLIFGERLNLFQWIGVLLSGISLFLLSRSSKREGVVFSHNRWIWSIALAAILGAISGLYDRHIMRQLDPVFVQGWYNLYQLLLMSVIVALLWWPRRHTTTPFRWSWAIPLISIFLTLADFVYFYALQQPDAMISVVSVIRRGSVVVSFLCGAIVFHEHNLRAKIIDLIFIIIGLIFLWFGTK